MKTYQTKKYCISELNDNKYVMSQYQTWMPGTFDSLETCKLVIKYESLTKEIFDSKIPKDQQGNHLLVTYDYVLNLLKSLPNYKPKYSI